MIRLKTTDVNITVRVQYPCIKYLNILRDSKCEFIGMMYPLFCGKLSLCFFSIVQQLCFANFDFEENCLSKIVPSIIPKPILEP